MKTFEKLCGIHIAATLLIVSTCWAQPRSIDVSVDARMELLAVVQYLSDYGERLHLISDHDFSYKQDIEKYFGPFRDHEAVRLFTEMSHDSFTFDAPPAVMLCLKEVPTLEQRFPFTHYLIQRAGGRQRLDRFVCSLRDFAEKTKFLEFFEAQQALYQTLIAGTRAHLDRTDYVKTLEDYCGMLRNDYFIILVPLFVGNYGPTLGNRKGTWDIYCIMGSKGIQDNRPHFGSAETFRHLAWHEWGHSFINPTTSLFKDEVMKCASLYDPIADRMKARAYGTWETCVNEHLLRALTTRLTCREFGQAAGDAELQREMGWGFAYIEALCESLKHYEKQRDLYPSLKDYYPELVKVLEDLSAADLGDEFYAQPFTGTVNNAVSDKKARIYILPTHEDNKEIQEKLQAYIHEVHQLFSPEALIITDKEALKKDLSAHCVMAYGTLKGNLWLNKRLGDLPVLIESDRVVAGETFEGSCLRFISAWPNPDNPQRGAVIYTAQKAEDVINIHRVFHGPTDYVVARGKQVLTSNDYIKMQDKWSFPRDSEE